MKLFYSKCTFNACWLSASPYSPAPPSQTPSSRTTYTIQLKSRIAWISTGIPSSRESIISKFTVNISIIRSKEWGACSCCAYSIAFRRNSLNFNSNRFFLFLFVQSSLMAYRKMDMYMLLCGRFYRIQVYATKPTLVI